MPGRYTQPELTAMPRDKFEVAAANNFDRDATEAAITQGHEAEFSFAAPAAEPDVTPTEIPLGTPTRTVPEPSPNVWASRKTAETYDFTAPSGQTCRMRRLAPEKLLEVGILDKITVLEALAAKLVDTAEGNPPAKLSVMPSPDEFHLLLDTINLLVPLAVVEPMVYADSAAAPEGEDVIRCSDIDLDDRLAIMAESIKGITALRSFRHAG